VLYFETFVVTDRHVAFGKGQLLTDEEYLNAVEEHGDDFVAKMGAEAIYDLLKSIDLKEEINTLREEINSTNSDTKIKKFSKRLKVIDSLLASNNRPEWMIMTFSGIAAELRPLCLWMVVVSRLRI